EGDVLGRRHVLAAEEDHAVLVERIADVVIGTLLQRLAQIDATNLGAGRCRHTANVDGGVFRCFHEPPPQRSITRGLVSTTRRPVEFVRIPFYYCPMISPDAARPLLGDSPP